MKKIFNLFLMLGLFFSLLIAGTTGKIVGKVLDSETGEPLIGCNILVEGTSLGAATDLNGSYFIVNVPPGTYVLKAMMIGYETVKTSNVQVSVDLTTEVNFHLSVQVIEGQEITVVATKPTVRLDQTSMAAVMNANQIEKLPVAEVSDLISLQAGIVTDQGGGLHIRGGRSGEVAFWVDGISTTDSYDGSSIGQEIQNSSIQELQVISGTFNAEYGNSMSGIINIVTKDGGQKLSGGLEIYGGGYHTYDKSLFSLSEPFASWKGYNDLNGDGHWEGPEWFNDLNGNLKWDTGEPFEDTNNNGIWDSGEPLNSDVGLDGQIGDPTDNGSMIPNDLSNNNGNKNEPSLGEGNGKPDWGEHQFTPQKNGYVDKLNVFLAPFQIKNLNGYLSGPFPLSGKKVNFYTNLRYYSTLNRYYGKRLFMPTSDFGDGEIVPLAPFGKLSAQAKLTYKPFPSITLSYSQFYSEKQYKNYDPNFKYVPDGLMNRFEKDRTQSVTLTHTLSPRTYYELKMIDFSSSYWEYLSKDYHDTPFQEVLFSSLNDQALKDSIDVYDGVTSTRVPRYVLSGITFDSSAMSWVYHFQDLKDWKGYVDPSIFDTNPAWSFFRGGTQGGRFSRNTSYRVIKFDLSSQVDKRNQIKTGIEYKQYNLWADDKSVQYLMTGSYGFSVHGDTIGFNPIAGSRIVPYTPTIYPTYTSSHDYFRVHPRQFSAYIQDKLELTELIVNFGLRFDYFDPQFVVPRNSLFPGNRKYYLATTPNDTVIFWEHEYSQLQQDVIIIDSLSAEGSVHIGNALNNQSLTSDELNTMRNQYRWEYGYRSAPVSHQLSPRIGISYPITDKGAIHVSYGYFFQVPNFSYLYENPEFEIQDSDFGGILGNAGLKPERTVMYEVGFKQEIAFFTSLDFTMFYRDTRDWVGISAPIDKYPVGNYFRYENKDYANTRGFTLAIRRDFVRGFGASIDYSWMVAEGTYSNPTDAYFDAQNQNAPRISLIPLNWDQTHTLNATATVGGKAWVASIIGKYWSGTPYTPVIKTGSISGTSAFSGFAENSDRKPNYFSLDLRSSYQITIWGAKATLFCNIYNVLDIRNEVNVWGDTGRATYTLEAKDVPATSSDRIGHLKELLLRPDFFSDPRKINFGLTYNF